jgi:hypothetical protein
MLREYTSGAPFELGAQCLEGIIDSAAKFSEQHPSQIEEENQRSGEEESVSARRAYWRIAVREVISLR